MNDSLLDELLDHQQEDIRLRGLGLLDVNPDYFQVSPDLFKKFIPAQVPIETEIRTGYIRLRAIHPDGFTFVTLI